MKERFFSVIPEPSSFSVVSFENALVIEPTVNFDGVKESEKAVADLNRFIKEVYFYECIGGGKGKIKFILKEKAYSAEGYYIKSEKDFVTVEAGDEAGFFYAVQSLKQLIFQGKGALPFFETEDAPRYALRGFMLDCGRYFFTVDAVKQFIDMAALHKLNEFHWHLSEDGGFRCQLDSAPLLTEIGAYRSHTNFNNKPHGGFYTKADMKEIVAYANDRCIKVIPEIDVPGHSMSMLAAYPELGCFGRQVEVAPSWGIKFDVLCAGKENTYRFMEKILAELIEIFGTDTVHLGGDEVPTLRWSMCPDCLALMKKEGLKNVGDLHTYFLQRMADFLKSKGIKVRMWNDTKKDYMVDPSVTWELWNGEIKKEDVFEELKKGRKFILACSEWNYLDLPYGLTSLEKCYSFDFGIENENILGVEACLWSEFVPDMKKADYMTYPRLGAVAESAWCKKGNKNYERFLKKIPSYKALLLTLGTKPAEEKRYNPSLIPKLASKLYWERRKLCWAGLSNIITNYQVKKKYGVKEK